MFSRVVPLFGEISNAANTSRPARFLLNTLFMWVTSYHMQPLRILLGSSRITSGGAHASKHGIAVVVAGGGVVAAAAVVGVVVTAAGQQLQM